MGGISEAATVSAVKLTATAISTALHTGRRCHYTVLLSDCADEELTLFPLTNVTNVNGRRDIKREGGVVQEDLNHEGVFHTLDIMQHITARLRVCWPAFPRAGRKYRVSIEGSGWPLHFMYATSVNFTTPRRRGGGFYVQTSFRCSERYERADNDKEWTGLFDPHGYAERPGWWPHYRPWRTTGGRTQKTRRRHRVPH